MSRKDYENIAIAIGQLPDSNLRILMVNAIVPIFKSDNPRFDIDRFCKAVNLAQRVCKTHQKEC